MRDITRALADGGEQDGVQGSATHFMETSVSLRRYSLESVRLAIVFVTLALLLATSTMHASPARAAGTALR